MRAYFTLWNIGEAKGRQSCVHHEAEIVEGELSVDTYDYIDDDNPMRVIDVFVDELDLGGPGFDDQYIDTCLSI